MDWMSVEPSGAVPVVAAHNCVATVSAMASMARSIASSTNWKIAPLPTASTSSISSM